MLTNAVISVSFEDEATTEPVTLAEAKNWMKVGVTTDDDLINELITSARATCEEYLNISLISRTVKATIKNELGGIRLPYGPVKSKVHVLCNSSVLSQCYLNNQRLYPSCYNGDNLLLATYEAGYETAIPKVFKTAIKNVCAWLYFNRGDEQNKETTLADVLRTNLKAYRRVQ